MQAVGYDDGGDISEEYYGRIAVYSDVFVNKGRIVPSAFVGVYKDGYKLKKKHKIFG